MARPKRNLRMISKHLCLPEELVARMELELFSDVEGRIPMGAQAELITQLLREHFAVLDTAREGRQLP